MMAGLPDHGHEGEPREGEYFDDAAEHEGEELTLVDEDQPLPWLEPDYEDAEEGFDSGRFLGFLMLALLALGALLLLFWWLSHRNPDPELVADGSTIEAPAGPIKERPKDQGGKTFAGTGDLAPKVGDGQSSEARLADGGAPRPSIDAATTAAPVAAPSGKAATGPAPAPAATAPTAGGASGGASVQVGAYSSRASAEAGWNKLVRRTSALQGVSHRIEEGTADIGTVYRLQAVPGDAAAAKRLCDTLKGQGIACQVKR